MPQFLLPASLSRQLCTPSHQVSFPETERTGGEGNYLWLLSPASGVVQSMSVSSVNSCVYEHVLPANLVLYCGVCVVCSFSQTETPRFLTLSAAGRQHQPAACGRLALTFTDYLVLDTTLPIVPISTPL